MKKHIIKLSLAGAILALASCAAPLDKPVVTDPSTGQVIHDAQKCG